MKPKADEDAVNQEEENKKTLAANELRIQSDRILKILDETIVKLKLLTFLPTLLLNDGELLRHHFPKKDVEMILALSKDPGSQSKSSLFDPHHVENNSVLDLLMKIAFYQKRGKRRRSLGSSDGNEAQVSYCLHLLLNSASLVKMVNSLEMDEDTGTRTFIDAMVKLRKVVDARLKISAAEELKTEAELKIAYRASVLMTENIRDLELQLTRQRDELQMEHDRKYLNMISLRDRIAMLKARAQQDISKIVFDSETLMMKDYLKSTEIQEQLAQEAKQSTQQFEALLQDHLVEEKSLRAKKFKVETQLASWLTKYDTDVGDKQAQFEELEKKFNEEKDEYEELEEKVMMQEKEYVVLMAEKDEEERLMFEEMAYEFLLQRSARRIQRYFRTYLERKSSRKRGRKSKGEKGKKKKGSAKKEETTALRGGPDPNAIIEGKFGGELLAELKTEDDAFANKDVKVDLTAD